MHDLCIISAKFGGIMQSGSQNDDDENASLIIFSAETEYISTRY
jgi:hypothetical protein